MKPRVHFVAMNQFASGFLRAFWPAALLRSRGWEATATVGYPAAGAADVVIVHRPRPNHQRTRDLLRDAGARIVIQEDDDLRQVPDAFLVSAPNQFHDWLAAHEEAIRRSDGLIVTTPRLVDVYGPLAPHTWTVPNYLPLEAFDVRAARPVARGPGARVAWSSMVKTHRRDVEWFQPVARAALAGVTWLHVGDVEVSRALRLWGMPKEVHPYQAHPLDLYAILASADVGIVPLDPGLVFNRAKSWLKAMEYNAVGVPAIGVAGLPEQEAWIEDGVTGLLGATPEAFADAVQRLARDRILRERMGENAERKARANTLERRIGFWESALSEAMEREAVSA